LFCVECGREDEALIGSLCRDCFSKKHVWVTLPDHVDVILCAHCSSMLSDDRWVDVGSVKEAAEAAIRSAFKVPKDAICSNMRVSLTEKDERNLDAQVKIAVMAQGVEVERELGTIVRLKRGSCTECSKQKGNYYESLLQVRGGDRSMDPEVERSIDVRVRDRVAGMRKNSRGVFISKIEHVKGGIDFFFGSTHAARTIARELQDSMCADFKESSSLWGRRDGEEIYRMTFLVRLPSFGPGDVVEIGGKDSYISRMSKGVLRVIDLARGEERSIRLKDAGECVVARPASKIPRAVVLSETPTELQLLDPETMATLDVRKPAGFRRDGDQIRLAKTKSGIYVLSDDW
jgi:nonsense-mediated mRNA decay protein 3